MFLWLFVFLYAQTGSAQFTTSYSFLLLNQDVRPHHYLYLIAIPSRYLAQAVAILASSLFLLLLTLLSETYGKEGEKVFEDRG